MLWLFKLSERLFCLTCALRDDNFLLAHESKMSKRKATASGAEKNPKQPKLTGQVYRTQYTEKYPCIKSTKRPDFVRCEICLSEFSIRHGGLNDVERHCEGNRHKSRGEMVEEPKISTFFSSDSGLGVMKAEALFTSFLVEHNFPAAAADHAG